MPTLICDLGGVFFTVPDPQRRIDAWRSLNAGVLGMQVGADLNDDLLRRFAEGRVGEAEYALHLRARLGWSGSDEQLVQGWGAAQGPVNLDVLEALTRLRDRGWRLVGAGDDTPWDARVRDQHFGWALTLFDQIVTARETGACRPDPRFFAGLRSAGGQGQKLYVDDEVHNVAAARRAGLDGHLFTDAESLVSACLRLVVTVD